MSSTYYILGWIFHIPTDQCIYLFIDCTHGRWMDGWMVESSQKYLSPIDISLKQLSTDMVGCRNQSPRVSQKWL